MRQIFLIILGLSVSVYADFTRDNSTQIVTDNNTGLQWQDNADVSAAVKKWIDAIEYCEALTLGGQSDWRLPNMNELLFIVERGKSDPAIDSAFQYIGSSSRYYWSSTTDMRPYYTDRAWYIDFDDGDDGRDFKSVGHLVRCVRAGE